MNDWMKNIPDDFLVSEINLVGTHNSCTQFMHFKHFCRCQNKNIFDQLNMGIRLLDIRFNFDGEKLKLSHSIFNCKKSRNKKEDLLFSDVFKDCELFLKENPTETILMSVKREAGKKEEETFDYFYNTFIKNSDIFYTKNAIPTLKEARGKIVLLNRCGADIENSNYTDDNTGINLTGWPYQNSRKEASLQKVLIPLRNGKSESFFYLQDFFKLKPKKKWEIAVLPAIQNSPQDKSIIFNFFSGSNGFSSPKRYSKILFKRFSDYELIPMKKYGWFVLDFPTKKIIKKIVLSNY
ncbi:MAG: phosphatidylinositol-specific phospholipase C domain-containing protein [Ruminococcaceae bacterium]|nr:phosphatidylinositol-specific phospholipase C domain-containing protein [Oscillospiraceae bacterium]